MRVFHVTLTREFDCTVAAESEEELQEALKEAKYDFDDWDPPEWGWSVFDPMSRKPSLEALDKMLTNIVEPDMGVQDGKVYAFEDCDDLMQKIEETLRAHREKVYMEKHQMKLPGFE